MEKKINYQEVVSSWSNNKRKKVDDALIKRQELKYQSEKSAKEKWKTYQVLKHGSEMTIDAYYNNPSIGVEPLVLIAKKYKKKHTKCDKLWAIYHELPSVDKNVANVMLNIFKIKDYKSKDKIL